ncbi:MAG TPA: ribonuclease HI family protein [Candidatus Thermoplasmatota archaeon]|nr:ribonuclease HI family protein [Candidatus Thermoplasmatota archaeon]
MGAWVLHFDGLFEPRYQARGIATYGFTADHDGERVGEGKGLLFGPGEGGSANVAEFGALIHGLAFLEDRKEDDCPVVIRGDSRLVIETVAGRWNLSSPRLLPLHKMARRILAEIPGPKTLEKVSREENAGADRLTREAYHEAAAAHPAWGLGPHAKTNRRRADPEARPPSRL